jgi:riboflavin synthase
MFTGLVREVGSVVSVARREGVTRLDIRAPRLASGLAVGDSLAVNGICLTVTHVAPPMVRVDASFETRRVTTLEAWRPGTEVHLEPALRAGEAIGGHFVLGHVDATGRVTRVERRKAVLQLTVSLEPSLAARLLSKGSIAVDGVSLTLDEGPFTYAFTVTLIPHTLRETRFGRVRTGDAVNLELDVLSKAAGEARHPVTPPARTPGLTMAAILRRGWSR